MRGDVFRHSVVDRLGGEEHVLGPGALRATPLEAVDVVLLAHPVLAASAEAALPARYDLLRNGMIAEFQAVLAARPFPKRHHLADELVPRRHGRLDIGRNLVRAPHARPVVRLDVAGADARGQHTHQHLPWARLRDGHLLEPVVARPVDAHRFHRFRYRHRPSSREIARRAGWRPAGEVCPQSQALRTARVTAARRGYVRGARRFRRAPPQSAVW